MALGELIPWRRQPALRDETFPMFASLQRDMNRMLDDLWHERGELFRTQDTSLMRAHYTPDIEMRESDTAIDVTAEIPGLTDKDVTVAVSRDGERMTLSGEKKFEKEVKGEQIYRAERAYGAFRRTIELPHRVDANRVKATCKNGVLKVHMSKLPEQQQDIKQIPVSVE